MIKSNTKNDTFTAAHDALAARIETILSSYFTSLSAFIAMHKEKSKGEELDTRYYPYVLKVLAERKEYNYDEAWELNLGNKCLWTVIRKPS